MAEVATKTADVGSPEWWLARLHKKLQSRQTGLLKVGNYYDGHHNLKFATEQFRNAFRGMFASFSDNWCQLVVDAVEERLDVEGFRFPDPAEANPEDRSLIEQDSGDNEAWDIWQENGLDEGSQMGHVEALVYGYANVLVWNRDEDADQPLITVERARETIVQYAAGDRRRRAAGLKVWRDDEAERVHATLYLPDAVWKYESVQKVTEDPAASELTEMRWQTREPEGEDYPLGNKLGVVPLIPLPNRPRLGGYYESEIAQVLSVQDAANKLFLDMLVASEFMGFPQRWATGIEIPVDPETGQAKTDLFKMAIDRFLHTSAKDARFGTLEPAQLENYVKAIELAVQHLASRTRTPPHYFFLRGEFPSGESIKAAETGLVAKTKRKMRHFGGTWEEALRLAFMVKNSEKARVMNAETIWRDPESRSEAQLADAVAKRRDIGISLRQSLEDLGYTPQQQERILAEVAGEAERAEANSAEEQVPA